MADWWRSYIRQGARKRGLDPQAVLAIAAVEGLSGAVGDQGTSYGPFQLHRGGALPAGQGRGWAESPAGIDYALNRIAGVARGLHGQQAIAAISRRFERPADPASEIAKASALYGRVGGGGNGAVPTGPGAALTAGPGPAAPDLRGQRANVLASLIAASQSSSSRPDYSPLFEAMHELRQGEAAGSMKSDLHPNAPPPANLPASGKRSLSFLRPFGAQFGLTITSTTEGKHVPGSYHYQGRAVDFGGSPAKMMALQRYALAHPGEFTEAFYDPAGAYVKNGKVYKGAIGGHGDHVHLAR